MSNIYQWINKEKSRYYTITINKNESKIIMNYSWGGCHSKRGGKKNICVETEDEMQFYIYNMMKRRKSRGYELIAP